MTAVLLGVGITLVTSIKQAGGALDSGIDVYLFGEATSLTDEKFYFLRIIILTVIVLLLLFFRRLRVVIFNIDMAKTTHFHTMYYVHLINIFVVCLVALSVKLMGVFLAVSIFLIPAVTARLWNRRGHRRSNCRKYKQCFFWNIYYHCSFYDVFYITAYCTI